MAGRGPAPKPAGDRARRNRGVIEVREVVGEFIPRPALPDFQTIWRGEDGEQLVPFEWPEMTRRWWNDLDALPTAGEMTAADWSYLLDTARLHAAYWFGNLSVAAELRLREAKYGFTPEDRARLRIQFATATSSEVDAVSKVSSARERLANIRKADGDKAGE